MNNNNNNNKSVKCDSEDYSPGDDYYNSFASLYGLERNFNETNDELMKRIKNSSVNKNNLKGRELE